jgi:amino acid adenylation domain-containing protein
VAQEHSAGVAILNAAPAEGRQNGTTGPPDGPATLALHGLVAAQVRRTPDAVAVLRGSRSWTYRELDDRARRLAVHLRSAGVKQDDSVAVCLDPSPELLLGLLAVFYAGGAYVPVSPSTPADRALRMLADVAPRCLLTEKTSARTWAAPCVEVDVDLATHTVGHDEASILPARVHPESLAYIIYTSGSTGSPKGVMIPHRAICNTLRWRQLAFPLDITDRALVTFDYVFDASVVELFQPLLGGATVVFPDEDLGGDPDRITRQVRRYGITILGVVPSWLALLGQSSALTSCRSLRLLFVGGEPLPPAVLDAALRRTPARICNMYGPSEAAVEATYAICRTGEAVCIGGPIDGVGVRVLDECLRPCQLGEVGELFISGEGLARGYVRDPGLTAARFLPDPFARQPGGRMYATGDLCRVTGEGQIEYMGRRDLQVKVNGQRIELEEVEAALEAVPDVLEAAVTVREDSAGRRRMEGFVVPRPGRERGLEPRVREQLRRSLPGYLVPPVLAVLPRLPRTTSGKKDRRALPQPRSSPGSRADVGEVDAVTGLLLRTWRSVLDRPDLGARDDFFASGGTSIQAAILTHRLEDALGEHVYSVAVYDAPTIERMEAYLRENYPGAVARLAGARISPGAGGARVLRQTDLDRLRGCVRTLPGHSSRPMWTPNPSAVFVLSPPRSGTTLLRTMLASHPALFAPPELQLLNFDTLRERRRVLSNGRDDFWLQGSVRALMALHECDVDSAYACMERLERADWSVQQFYRYLQDQLDGQTLVDKTPTYALDLATLRRAEEAFDKPRYIHLVRDAGAAVDSFLEAKLHVFFPPFFTEPPGLPPRQLAEAVWDVSHENITTFLGEVDATRMHRVFFDELVREPVATMRALSSFLGIPFMEETADPYKHDPRSIMTDPVHPNARMLGDVKFRQHGRVRDERADRQGDSPAGVPLGVAAHRLQARLHAARVRPPSSLVTLRGEGTLPALFLPHPAGGGVTCYQHLVAGLPPGPRVHAYRSVVGADGPPGCLVELATTYVQDLRRQQPQGPYHLCGWSFGGIVAFEMAAQLVAAGEEVAFLALLESRLRMTRFRLELTTDEDLLRVFLRDHELDGTASGRPEHALAQARLRGIVPAQLSMDEFVDVATRYGVAFRDNVDLARLYKPSGRVPRALFVEAAERPGGGAAPGSQLSDWSEWVDLLDREQVAGDHFSILRPPYVRRLAAVLATHMTGRHRAAL